MRRGEFVKRRLKLTPRICAHFTPKEKGVSKVAGALSKEKGVVKGLPNRIGKKEIAPQYCPNKAELKAT